MATSLQARGPEGIPVDLRATPDGQLIVNVGDIDRELVSVRYICKQEFTGASLGDVIRQTVALDIANESMTVVSVLWENEASGSIISAPPSVSVYLEEIRVNNALTLSQLLSLGLATASNQVAQIGYLADLADGNDRFGSYKFAQSEEIDDTTYVLKTNGTGWLMTRLVSTISSDVASYASELNNSAVTLAYAWTQRETLAYGGIGAA